MKVTKEKGVYIYSTQTRKKVYALRFKHRGVLIQEKGFSTISIAKTRRREIEVAIEDGSYFKKEYTLNEYYEIYRKKKISSGVWSKTTQINNDKNFNVHLKSRFGNKKLNDITKHDVQLFFNKLAESGKYRHLSLLEIKRNFAAIINDAIANELLEVNRVKNVVIPPVTKEKIDKSLSQKDYEKISNYIKSNWNDIDIALFILMSHGLRRGEALGVKLKNITFENDFVRIEISDSRIPNEKNGTGRTKTNKNRVIFMNNSNAHYLKNAIVLAEKFYISKGLTFGDNNYISVNKKGNLINPDYITNKFKSLSKKLDTSVSPHKLRHYFATSAQLADISPRLVADFLGHTNISMTDKYTHATESGAIKVMKKVSNYI